MTQDETRASFTGNDFSPGLWIIRDSASSHAGTGHRYTDSHVHLYTGPAYRNADVYANPP